MPSLFDPLELRSVTLRNRIGMSPMCMYSADDGMPGDWHIMHYVARAAGGCGLVLTEATAVEPRGRISPGDTGLWNDLQVCRWRIINRMVREHGAVPGVQLAHAGRKAGTHTPQTGKGPLAGDDAWGTVAPSPVPFDEGWPIPHALNSDELERMLNTWGDAVRRARAAEFEVLELHMAHGYLLHQFLSPHANQREDEFGGDLEGRMRFPLMVAQQVRLEWPDELPLVVRISTTDWTDDGWSVEDSVAFAWRLKELGVDLVDCSSGGIVPQGTQTGVAFNAEPGYQVPFATRVKADAGVATAAVGLITDPRQANAIIKEGQADMVLLGRALLREPHWALNAARELGHDTTWPWQYERGRPAGS